MVFQIAIIYSFLFFTYSNINVDAYCNLIHNYDGIDWNDIYDVDERRLIAEIPSSKIKLYYLKDDKDFGVYRGFILEMNEGKRYFSWDNVTNPSYAPQLTLSDLDKDGKDELIIQLCKGYGMGIFDGEVHVIKEKLFDEILVQNPTIILYKNVTVRELPEQFEIILKGKKVILNKKGMLIPPYSKVGIGFGNDNTRYEVKNNTLYARVPVGVSTIIAGELIVKYKFRDSIFQMESIDYFNYKN